MNWKETIPQPTDKQYNKFLKNLNNMKNWIDYEITTTFDDSLMVYGAYGYTLHEVTWDLKEHCNIHNTDIKDYIIKKV